MLVLLWFYLCVAVAVVTGGFALLCDFFNFATILCSKYRNSSQVLFVPAFLYLFALIAAKLAGFGISWWWLPVFCSLEVIACLIKSFQQSTASSNVPEVKDDEG